MPYRITERAEQKRQQMRQSLIAAARRLFVRQGYEATTMQHIVREAGTSIGNCYFYFSTKEALLRAIVEDFAQHIGQSIDAAIAPLSAGPEQLAIALAQAVRTTLTQAEIARVLLVETHIPELREMVLHYFVSRLSHLLETGHFANGTAVTLATLAWQGTTFQILESAILGTLEEDEQTITRFLVQWNLRALGVPEGQIGQALSSLELFLVQSSPEEQTVLPEAAQRPEEES
jgi:AcrR family transcriptional regulator